MYKQNKNKQKNNWPNFRPDQACSPAPVHTRNKKPTMQTNQQEKEEELCSICLDVGIKIYTHDMLWKGIAWQVLRQYQKK